jgi:hypothetical protein
MIYVLCAACLLVGVLLLGAGAKWWMIVAFGGAGGLAGQWWEDNFGLPGKVEKLYRQYKGLAEPMSFCWDVEVIEGENAEGYGRRKWKDFVRMREDDEVFLLYVTDQLWHVYAKRWFASSSQIDEFRKYARQAGA